MEAGIVTGERQERFRATATRRPWERCVAGLQLSPNGLGRLTHDRYFSGNGKNRKYVTLRMII